jgi:hypothetical protein
MHNTILGDVTGAVQGAAFNYVHPEQTQCQAFKLCRNATSGALTGNHPWQYAYLVSDSGSLKYKGPSYAFSRRESAYRSGECGNKHQQEAAELPLPVYWKCECH